MERETSQRGPQMHRMISCDECGREIAYAGPRSEIAEELEQRGWLVGDPDESPTYCQRCNAGRNRKASEDQEDRPGLGDSVFYRFDDGSLLPAVIVRVWGDGDLVSLQVFRDDGSGTIWRRAVERGDGPDTWQWSA